MQVTRIDEQLTVIQLEQALLAFTGVFERYCEILSAVVAIHGSRDGGVLHSIHPHSMMNQPAVSRKYCDLIGDMCFKDGYILPLYSIGLSVDDIVANNSSVVLPASGVNLTPLALSGLRYGRFFAVKPIMPADKNPIWHQGISDITEVTIPSIFSDEEPCIPEGYVLAPEIAVFPVAYLLWESILGRILEYRITPLQPLFPSPVLLPSCDDGYIAIQGYSRIGLDENLFLRYGENNNSRFPSFEDAIDPLVNYRTYVTSNIRFIKQEIERRKMNEQSSKIKVHIVLSADDKLQQLTVDGNARPIAGRFKNAAALLMTLWTASGRRLAKADIKDPDTLYKGKEQLRNMVGARIFDCIYHDDIKDGDVWLTDAISVEVLSTGKR